ncbi:hypothetical protein [Catellatospora sichuanensis]|uniref:hypothetical protein n=1 Tax=Catellatospora sichuanensis TaxID=1969805 RepID=UPI00118223D5|nr:hypothetical protein [Catellatospora sichuanensis]
MLKLYRRDDDGVLHYHESWVDPSDGTVADHRGRAGQRGTVDYYAIPDGADHDDCVEDILATARAAGYAELPADARTLIEVQYDLEDPCGSTADLDLREAVDRLLNEELGWHGLGEWVGASMGSGQMEIAYTVVDVEQAVRTIRSTLERSPYPMYSRINVQEPDN